MLLRFQLFLDKHGLWLGKPTPASSTYLITSDLAEILQLLHLDHTIYLNGFSSRESLFIWMETGHIDNIPLIRGWRGATAKPGDAFLEQWATRRACEAKVEIDREAIQAHLLEITGKKEDFGSWRSDLEKKAELAAKEKARSEAIRAEVTCRLEGTTLRGRAIKDEAKRIRAAVEAEFAAP
jgi:hypothetical protein